MKRKGILFILSGPSGVGKGTITSALLDSLQDLLLSVSITTRMPRNGEIEGESYFFVDKAAFETMIQNDELLEWANVYQNYYGTPKNFVMSHLKKGQDILLEIDTQGALKIKENMPQSVFIFIAPPRFEDLGLRIRTRDTDSADSIQTRLSAGFDEMQQMKHYDYVVVNGDLAEAVKQVKAIVIAERCRYDNLIMEGKN